MGNFDPAIDIDADAGDEAATAADVSPVAGDRRFPHPPLARQAGRRNFLSAPVEAIGGGDDDAFAASVDLPESSFLALRQLGSSAQTKARAETSSPRAVTGTDGSNNGDGGTFVRNRVEYERSVLKLQEILQRRLSLGYSDGELIKRSEDEDVVAILESLQETNRQDEDTIRRLQKQLIQLTNERDAARKESNGLSDELRKERLGFAEASRRLKKEVEGWKGKAKKLWKRSKRLELEMGKKDGVGDHRNGNDKEAVERWSLRANDLERKCERMEKDLEEKDAMIKLLKVRGAREKNEAIDVAAVVVGALKDVSSTAETAATALLNDSLERGLSGSASRNDSIDTSMFPFESCGFIVIVSSETDSRVKWPEDDHIRDDEEPSNHDEIRARAERLLRQADGMPEDHQSSEKGEDEEDEKEKNHSATFTAPRAQGRRRLRQQGREDDRNRANDEVGSWKGKHVIVVGDSNGTTKRLQQSQDLEDKLCELVAENVWLLARCRQLERELASSRGTREPVGCTPKPNNQEINGSFVSIATLAKMNEGGKSFASESSTGVIRREVEELLATIEDLQRENEALHGSMKEEVDLVNDMDAKMAEFLQFHQSSMEDYEKKLSNLTDELGRSKLSREELVRAISALKEENDVLRIALQGVEDAEERYELELAGLAAEKERALHEKLEAFQTCEVLQREIDLLRRQAIDDESFYSSGSERSAENSDKHGCFELNESTMKKASRSANQDLRTRQTTGHSDNNGLRSL